MGAAGGLGAGRGAGIRDADLIGYLPPLLLRGGPTLLDNGLYEAYTGLLDKLVYLDPLTFPEGEAIATHP